MRIDFILLSAGVSGGNRAVFPLADGLSARGHDVTLTSLAIVVTLHASGMLVLILGMLV